MTTSLETRTKPEQPPPSPPALTPVELARWAWRQLTSMRTALVLLFLLALGAVPGSVVPQADVDAAAVSRWQDQHPTLTPIYEWLGLFSVYDSVWFSAIYILLMVSLVGCILPRTRIYWRAARAKPPRAPRNLARMPEARTFTLDEDSASVHARAARVLRRKRFRVVSTSPGEGDTDDAQPREVAAERGYLREAGNLVFHISLLVVLVGFALGTLFGFKGGVIVVNGQGFSNSLSQYDDFAPGRFFGADDLDPFSFTVDDFDVTFLRGGPQSGMPTEFDADLTYTEAPGERTQKHNLRVNHPLTVDGTSVFLVGHGYAPLITVRDGENNVVYDGPAVFLPQDSSFSSFGVVKVPDAVPTQLGFEGLFLPTYGFTMEAGPFSRFPDAIDPVLSLLPYSGDLGLDSGEPQSVYSLDKDELEVMQRDGRDARLDIALGQTKQLPDGAGSIEFRGVERWVKLQISETPGKGIALGGVVLAIVGLLGSLFIRPRRAWVRVRDEGDGRTVVELAGLDRSSGGDLSDEVDELERLIKDPGTLDKERQ